MAATIKGLTDVAFAIASAESGLVVQRFSVNRRTNKKEMVSNVGDIVAVATGYGIRGDVSMSGYAKGSFTTSLGATLTVANTVAGNGLTAGTIILDEANDDLSAEDFVQLAIRGSAYNITPP